MSCLSHYGIKVIRAALKDALYRHESFLYHLTQDAKPDLLVQFSAEADHVGGVAACLINDLGGIASAW